MPTLLSVVALLFATACGSERSDNTASAAPPAESADSLDHRDSAVIAVTTSNPRCRPTIDSLSASFRSIPRSPKSHSRSAPASARRPHDVGQPTRPGARRHGCRPRNSTERRGRARDATRHWCCFMPRRKIVQRRPLSSVSAFAPSPCASVTIDDFREAAAALGAALGQPGNARTLVDSVDATLDRVRAAVRGAARPRVVWPSWESPVIVVGGESFEASCSRSQERRMCSPIEPESVAGVSIEEIARRDPDFVLAGPIGSRVCRRARPGVPCAPCAKGRWPCSTRLSFGRPGVVIGMAAVALARALHPEPSGPAAVKRLVVVRWRRVVADVDAGRARHWCRAGRHCRCLGRAVRSRRHARQSRSCAIFARRAWCLPRSSARRSA